MDAAKRARLEAAGFHVGAVAEFLGLTPEESELVEIKVALSSAVIEQRKASRLSQTELAEKIRSSQSRVAKMERGDASVSLDLLIRALVAQGMTRGELAEVVAGRREQVPPAVAKNGSGRRSRRPQGVQSPHEPSATERRHQALPGPAGAAERLVPAE